MAEFHQHPAGVIYVRTPKGVYCAPAPQFKDDYGVFPPALPKGAVERIYCHDGFNDNGDPIARHSFFDPMGNQIDPSGPIPWEWGEDVIAAIDKLLAAQSARAPVPPRPEEFFHRVVAEPPKETKPATPSVGTEKV